MRLLEKVSEAKGMEFVEDSEALLPDRLAAVHGISIIQNLNARTPEGRRRLMEARRAAEVYLRCCADMYQE